MIEFFDAIKRILSIRNAKSHWDVLSPETIKYSVVISGAASLLTFSGGFEFTGNATELVWEHQLFNAHTENPIQQTETIRYYNGKPMTIKSGGCTLKSKPNPPWNTNHVRSITMTGTIDGSPIAPYTLIIYFRDAKGTTKKKTINLVC